MILILFFWQTSEQRPKRPASEPLAELVVDLGLLSWDHGHPYSPAPIPTNCQALHTVHAPIQPRRWGGPRYIFWEGPAPVVLFSSCNRRCTSSWPQENTANQDVYSGLPSVIALRHWLPVVIICLNSEPPTTQYGIILSKVTWDIAKEVHKN